MKTKIRINSIFPSINGEVSGRGQGSLCTFIRFQGCNLKCSYCDTKKSQRLSEGPELTIPQIVKEVKKLGLKNITITGGEPLLQYNGLKELVKALHSFNYIVSIETNGSLPIPYWQVCWVADWKTPSSGMHDPKRILFLRGLGGGDFLKFVIADEVDFNDAIKVAKKITKYDSPHIVFSPAHGKLAPGKLVNWMLSEKICRNESGILNLQIHKLIDVL